MDCSKSARTDDAGQFEIQDLDESLRFNVLIAKEKYRATLVRVDPVVDKADVTLKRFEHDVADNQKMLGKVLDAAGKPIAGAIVWITGAQQGERKWWGQVKQVERVSITGEDGKFLLTSEVPFDQWQLTVRATGFCQHKTKHQPTGSNPYEIRLKEGVLLTGKVTTSVGEPAANHIVGILQRNCIDIHRWVGEQTIATDQNGRFSFTAVPPNDEWVIYSAIEGRSGVEFFQSEFFDSDQNGRTQDLGEFVIQGHGKLQGRLQLPPNESLPDELRVTVSRKYAWKSQTATVNAEGMFEFPNLPLNEPLVVQITAKGFKLDESKQTLQSADENGLGVFLDQEETKIEIPLILKTPT